MISSPHLIDNCKVRSLAGLAELPNHISAQVFLLDVIRRQLGLVRREAISFDHVATAGKLAAVDVFLAVVIVDSKRKELKRWI